MSPSLSTISFQFEWLSGASTFNTTLQNAPTRHKLMPLIMRRRGFLHHASMASSCDWEWDILDMKASRIMALQLALNLQTHWLTPVQLNRSQPWMSPASSHAGPLALARTQRDSLMGHQTKLPIWLTNIKVMNGKYHSLTAAPCAALLSLRLWAVESITCGVISVI